MKFELADIKSMIADKSLYLFPTDDFFINGRYDHETRISGDAKQYYRLFYYMAKQFKPRLSVELGGWQGTNAAHIAAGNSYGTVITIDHHTDPGDEVHKAKMIEATNRYSNLVYLQGWTWDVIEQVKYYGDIDLLFIDSWHHYEYAIKDWNLYRPLLSDGALVVCDDIINGGQPGDPIYNMDKFWDEMPEPKFLDKTMHTGYPIGFLKYKKDNP